MDSGAAAHRLPTAVPTWKEDGEPGGTVILHWTKLAEREHASPRGRPTTSPGRASTTPATSSSGAGDGPAGAGDPLVHNDAQEADEVYVRVVFAGHLTWWQRRRIS